jgi:hypothetical protein
MLRGLGLMSFCMPKNGDRVAKKLVRLESKLADCERSTAGRLVLHVMHLDAEVQQLGLCSSRFKGKQGSLDWVIRSFHRRRATNLACTHVYSRSISPKAPK